MQKSMQLKMRSFLLKKAAQQPEKPVAHPQVNVPTSVKVNSTLPSSRQSLQQHLGKKFTSDAQYQRHKIQQDLDAFVTSHRLASGRKGSAIKDTIGRTFNRFLSLKGFLGGPPKEKYDEYGIDNHSTVQTVGRHLRRAGTGILAPFLFVKPGAAGGLSLGVEALRAAGKSVADSTNQRATDQQLKLFLKHRPYIAKRLGLDPSDFQGIKNAIGLSDKLSPQTRQTLSTGVLGYGDKKRFAVNQYANNNFLYTKAPVNADNLADIHGRQAQLNDPTGTLSYDMTQGALKSLPWFIPGGQFGRLVPFVAGGAAATLDPLHTIDPDYYNLMQKSRVANLLHSARTNDPSFYEKSGGNQQTFEGDVAFYKKSPHRMTQVSSMQNKPMGVWQDRLYNMASKILPAGLYGAQTQTHAELQANADKLREINNQTDPMKRAQLVRLFIADQKAKQQAPVTPADYVKRKLIASGQLQQYTGNYIRDKGVSNIRDMYKGMLEVNKLNQPQNIAQNNQLQGTIARATMDNLINEANDGTQSWQDRDAAAEIAYLTQKNKDRVSFSNVDAQKAKKVQKAVRSAIIRDIKNNPLQNLPKASRVALKRYGFDTLADIFGNPLGFYSAVVAIGALPFVIPWFMSMFTSGKKKEQEQKPQESSQVSRLKRMLAQAQRLNRV